MSDRCSLGAQWLDNEAKPEISRRHGLLAWQPHPNEGNWHTAANRG